MGDTIDGLPVVDAEGEDVEKPRQNTKENIEFQRTSLVQADGIVSLPLLKHTKCNM